MWFSLNVKQKVSMGHYPVKDTKSHTFFVFVAVIFHLFPKEMNILSHNKTKFEKFD